MVNYLSKVLKNLQVIIFILFFSMLYSQKGKHIEIDYIFSKKLSKKDSTRINKLYKLFITDKKSVFISDESLKADSVALVIRKTGNINFGAVNMSLYELDETIAFNGLSNKIITYKHIRGAPIGYSDEAPTAWKLLNETKKVDNILLNSAEIEFGGRKWYAWYSGQYQLNEGPYKFKNLPGLIFEIHDSENIFNFQLSRIVNREKFYERDYSQFIIATKEKYKEVINTYIINPAPQLTKIFTQESRDRVKKNSIERHKNRYYIEKEFED